MDFLFFCKDTDFINQQQFVDSNCCQQKQVIKNYMRTIIPSLLFISLLIITSCSSSYYLKQADFENAISTSCKKIRKNSANQFEIDNLKYAYNKANQIDNNRIAFLLESGEENIWSEIHSIYTRLSNRQETVQSLPDEVLNEIDYKEINYGKQISQSKQHAADYYYNKGLTLLAKNTKYAARDAYNYFRKAKRYYSNYKDVNNKISEAKFYGTNHILFRIENQSRITLPEDFEEEILKISLTDLNRKWIEYNTSNNTTIQYDYYIQLSLKHISVSPEDTQRSLYTEEKEIEDGFKYQLDRNGNVQKDSTGNDIKIPIIKVITCNVVETSQHKEAVVSGTVDYINTSTGQLVNTHPVTAVMTFEHHSAEAHDNIDALCTETYNKIGIEPLPYPSNEQMIFDAASILKENTKKIIDDNSNWLEQ